MHSLDIQVQMQGAAGGGGGRSRSASIRSSQLKLSGRRLAAGAMGFGLDVVVTVEMLLVDHLVDGLAAPAAEGAVARASRSAPDRCRSAGRRDAQLRPAIRRAISCRW